MSARSPKPDAHSWIDPWVESFVRDLGSAGYARGTILQKQRIATAFVAWLRRSCTSTGVLDEAEAAFLKRRGKRSNSRRAHERAAVRGFLGHLRGLPGPRSRRTQSGPPQVAVAQQYADYLRCERGLTERSVEIYMPYVGAFLNSQGAAIDRFRPRSLDAQAVREHLLDCTRGRSTAYAKLVATSLRSFLRFLFLRGETITDLSIAVPTVRRWGRVPIHAFLAPEVVERVLAVPDRATPSGRRDYAILLLLARLGLRAGEVVALELDDIRWRSGEIVIRGKGRHAARLPLVSDVGEALAGYLQDGRGATSSRRVFLRKIAPRVGLTGPSAVGCVVRKALACAGAPRPRGYAAHIFRHSLATRMIRQGASLSEIAEVLRHRSPVTTEIYAKVDFEALRGVAQAWPGARAEAE